MAKEGIPFLVVCAVVVLAFFATGHPRIASVFILPGLFVAYFFRDPVRHPPAGDDIVVSAADGKVVSIEPDQKGPTGGPVTKLSIFLNVFDVHINRAPASGKIERIEYRKGRFLAAFKDEASDENERNTFVVSTRHGTIAFSQVAGLIARRIVCWKKEADQIVLGERVGMIMFGSRVDMYLPAGIEPQVKVGERVRGGETVVGRAR